MQSLQQEIEDLILIHIRANGPIHFDYTTDWVENQLQRWGLRTMMVKSLNRLIYQEVIHLYKGQSEIYIYR